MNTTLNYEYISTLWDKSILPTLIEYIKIPNKSPHFDKHWQKNGYMKQAVELITAWCKQNAVPDMQLEVIQEGDRTPVILMEIPGHSDDTILLYGHMDKQPEMTGWDEDLGPWKPVLKGDKLYGRGGADDGYSAFASLAALKSLKEQNIPHARCVILIEASEESGSPDLPFYVEKLVDRIGKPSLIVCLDSGCGNYEQLWLTTSLRGMAGGVLNIEVLKEGVHSGSGSGIAPSCFRIARQLINRIEDEKTGDILIEDFHVTIPEERKLQAKAVAVSLGQSVYDDLPFHDDVKPEHAAVDELILRRTWKPALSVTGSDGFPAVENAGNVTLPSLSFKLSLRLPPLVDAKVALAKLQKTLEENPPYDAKVSFTGGDTGSGWNAPKEEAWLVKAASDASKNYFGKDAMYVGEGGSIPFMGMLGKKFPQAQFVITGLLGPGSNAHGPNEFLHIPMGKKLTACVAEIIARHFER